MGNHFHDYATKLAGVVADCPWGQVQKLAESLYEIWTNNDQFFLCGNGGSAGNADHLANDFLYGVASDISSPGMRVESLCANNAVLTCLANDTAYEHIFSSQLQVKAKSGDLLVVLSGSGNSPNIIRALQVGNDVGMKTFAIVGFSGGLCKDLAHETIHFPVFDMQISEDLQLIVGHMCMQWLRNQATVNQL